MKFIMRWYSQCRFLYTCNLKKKNCLKSLRLNFNICMNSKLPSLSSEAMNHHWFHFTSSRLNESLYCNPRHFWMCGHFFFICVTAWLTAEQLAASRRMHRIYTADIIFSSDLLLFRGLYYEAIITNKELNKVLCNCVRF